MSAISQTLGAWTVPRRTLADGVSDALTRAILEGRFAPGDRLVEADIAMELDVSRGPVRDAFRHLAEQGLVEIIPHRGARVSNLASRDAYEVYTLMAAAEDLAFRLLKRRVTREVIVELRAVLQTMRQASDRGDSTELARADLEFTDRLFHYAGHRRLERVWQNQKFQSYLLVRGYVNRAYPSLPAVVEHHERLVALLETASPEDLTTYLREHVEYIERALRPLVEISEENE